MYEAREVDQARKVLAEAGYIVVDPAQVGEVRNLLNQWKKAALVARRAYEQAQPGVSRDFTLLRIEGLLYEYSLMHKPLALLGVVEDEG